MYSKVSISHITKKTKKAPPSKGPVMAPQFPHLTGARGVPMRTRPGKLPSSCTCSKHTIFYLDCMLKIGEGNGTPLQYSCLENPMDGGAWYPSPVTSLCPPAGTWAPLLLGWCWIGGGHQLGDGDQASWTLEVPRSLQSIPSVLRVGCPPRGGSVHRPAVTAPPQVWPACSTLI